MNAILFLAREFLNPLNNKKILFFTFMKKSSFTQNYTTVQAV